MAQKWVLKAIIAEALKNDSYWPKNHFLPIITPKPAYIYPNNFLGEIFQNIFLVTWDPYGVPGVPISGCPR